ncbi:MAG: hypothetical protein M0C28_35935 [Candidatus Moduliflexus flocculans]|nr:hypothetical protein [Candidatus Moduliflexus flocculans]
MGLMNRKIGLVERALGAPLTARIGLHALPPRLPGRPDEGRGGRLPDRPPGLRLPRPAPLRRRARHQRHGRLGHGLLQRLQPQVPVLPELPAQLAPRGHAGDGRGARGHDARSPGPGRPQHQPRLAGPRRPARPPGPADRPGRRPRGPARLEFQRLRQPRSRPGPRGHRRRLPARPEVFLARALEEILVRAGLLRPGFGGRQGDVPAAARARTSGRAGRPAKGLVVRHLVLPGAVDDTLAVLKWIGENLSPFTGLSLMSQYHPCYEAPDEIRRGVTAEEYGRAADAALALGLDPLFLQPEPFRADEHLVPDFRKEKPFRWK